MLRMQLDYREEPLAFYVARLARGEPFSFARYGDGEWNAIFGVPGQNSDGHRYFTDLGERLRDSLIHPRPFLHGIRLNVPFREARRISDFLRRHRVRLPWYDAGVFHRANIEGRLFPLVRELKGKPVVVIGPRFLRDLEALLFPIAHFIEIPLHDCWLARDEIVSAVRDYARTRPEGVVYSFSASMAANVLIHDLHPELGARNWLIDIGSVWDVYAGVLSRGYFERMSCEGFVRRNLEG
jgi:hypothetical protein